jgi:tRNA 2-thiocytidine biosynthesis protein TtcA
MLPPMPDPRQHLERQLFRSLKSTCDRYRLLEAGDRIMVAVSGGKDSYTLLHLLGRLTRALPFDVRLISVHLDQQQPGYDGAPLRAWLEQSGFEFEILSEDTYSAVVEHTKPGAAYCSMCSRLRRGILYTAAERLGCNKIALGHHRDDALETFLMNLFHSGRLQAMPASYVTDDGRFRVLRPLIETGELAIAEFARAMEFPILPCNLCGSQKLQRDQMAALIGMVEQSQPNVRSIMLNALRNVRPSHLLDPEVAEAWQHRPEHIRADTKPEAREPHNLALPVVSRVGRRLPLAGSSGGAPELAPESVAVSDTAL